MLIVKKFGGSSVSTPERIKNVARRVIEDYDKGHHVIVVLSAMGDATDEMFKLASSVTDKIPRREMDMLLTTGEQTSVALMSMAIQDLGYPAVSLNAFQISMHSTVRYGDARFKRIDSERIEHELGEGRIVVITGFQGVNQYDDYVTLGRGGSDTTAVALAATLHADKCEIYTDVDGVYTADPRLVTSAKKLRDITYDEMLELASVGAKVLHNRSVEMAKKYGVELVVRSSLNINEGTAVKESVSMEGMLISGVTSDKNVVRISLLGVKNEMGVEFRIFNELAKKHINVDTVLQALQNDGTKNIAFSIIEEYKEDALEILEINKGPLGIGEIAFTDNIAKISVVGAGMSSNPSVAVTVFESLFKGGIVINEFSTSEIRITLLVNESEVEKAIKLIHQGFELI